MWWFNDGVRFGGGGDGCVCGGDDDDGWWLKKVEGGVSGVWNMGEFEGSERDGSRDRW